MEWRILRSIGTLCAAALWVLTSGTCASAFPLGILTGAPKGTDERIGLELQEIMKSQSIELAVHSLAGSVENIWFLAILYG